MDKILYTLIGFAVFIAIGFRLFDPSASPPIKFDEANLAIASVCLLVAAGGLLLTRTRLGKRLQRNIEKRFRDEDDRVRTTPGKVREPPTNTNIP